MIRLTRLKGGVMHLNADMVATVEAHHDTVVTLLDGKIFVVLESAEEIVDEIITYRASVLARAEHLSAGTPDRDRVARLVVLRGESDGSSEGGR